MFALDRYSSVRQPSNTSVSQANTQKLPTARKPQSTATNLSEHSNKLPSNDNWSSSPDSTVFPQRQSASHSSQSKSSDAVYREAVGQKQDINLIQPIEEHSPVLENIPAGIPVKGIFSGINQKLKSLFIGKKQKLEINENLKNKLDSHMSSNIQAINNFKAKTTPESMFKDMIDAGLGKKYQNEIIGKMDKEGFSSQDIKSTNQLTDNGTKLLVVEYNNGGSVKFSCRDSSNGEFRGEVLKDAIKNGPYKNLKELAQIGVDKSNKNLLKHFMTTMIYADIYSVKDENEDILRNTLNQSLQKYEKDFQDLGINNKELVDIVINKFNEVEEAQEDIA